MVESPTDGEISPKVLGVVEKSDSVSWVLEIDESPIAVASRMLRRANSLRGVPSSKKKSLQSQQSLTLPSRNKKSPASRAAAASVKSTFEDSDAGTTITNADDAEVADDVAAKAETEKSAEDAAIPDISSFFDFLQDSDFETDMIADEETAGGAYFGNGGEKRPTSPFSNTTSSDSSLDLEGYGAGDAGSPSYGRFSWARNGENKVPKKTVTDSSSMSDSEDDRGPNFLSQDPKNANRSTSQ